MLFNAMGWFGAKSAIKNDRSCDDGDSGERARMGKFEYDFWEKLCDYMSCKNTRFLASC